MEILEKIRKLQYERDWNDYDLAKNAEISVAAVILCFDAKVPLSWKLCSAFAMLLI